MSYPIASGLCHKLVHALPGDPVARGDLLQRLTLFAERGDVRQSVSSLVLLVSVVLLKCHALSVSDPRRGRQLPRTWSWWVLDMPAGMLYLVYGSQNGRLLAPRSDSRF